MNLNKKLAYSIAGAAVAAVSTAMIVDYACRKAKEKTAYTAILVAGIAGIAAGTALGTLAVKEAKAAKKAAEAEAEADLLDDCEVEMIEDNIAEVLGGADDEAEVIEAEVIEAEVVEAEAVETEAVEPVAEETETV